ncbi:MAG: DUF1127 domain-containing protein [Cypionkella sp.]
MILHSSLIVQRPFLARLSRFLHKAVQLRQSRKSLARLDPHLLCDIGLTPEQARQEALRPIWDAPETWRQGK